MSGKLVIVATPIGNLGDLSPRAAEALRTADYVAAEDTRRTRALLSHLGISRPLLSHRAHNQVQGAAGLVKLMREGKMVVLVTDAGVPGISDPGSVVVRQAAEEGLTVEAVPGPSALTTALALSGFSADRFVFDGFLPQKKGRQTRLRELAAEPRTVAFFESPHRVVATLVALADLCPDREVVVARELTKVHEEVVRGTAAGVASRLKDIPPRGEYTLVLAPLPRGRRERDHGEPA